MRSAPTILLLGLLLAGMAYARPPQILSVRQSQPPEVYRSVGAQISPDSVTDKFTPVAQFEKFELRIDLQAQFQNPFDPDDIDLQAEFTSPSGKVRKIFGFYNPSSWAALWMVRFSPDETGNWRFVLKVKTSDGEAVSRAQEFSVVEGKHHGFISIAPNNRYLRYTDGASFYGVGMWYNDRYDLFNQGQITEAGLDELKVHGANFICFYNSPLETMGSGLGRYDQNRAGRLDQIFEWCEQRDLHIAWNLWFHSFISEKVWGGYNSRYRNNPYRLVTSAEELFTNETAWKFQCQLHRYIVARWGYSRALFLWFVIDEANGTEAWQKDDGKNVEAWCIRVCDWFKANDPYQRPTTGTMSGSLGQYWTNGYALFDIAAREIYETQGYPMPTGSKLDWVNSNPLKISYLNYAGQFQKLWREFQKPVMLGECGAKHAFFDHTMPGYQEMHHNTIWTALANGQCLTPCWWDHDPEIVPAVVDASMLHLSEFVRDIPFASENFQPATLALTRGDGWVMLGKNISFGWAVNPISGISGETITVTGLADGEYDLKLYLPWSGKYLAAQRLKSVADELKFTVPEAQPRDKKPRYLGADIAFKLTPAPAQGR